MKLPKRVNRMFLLAAVFVLVLSVVFVVARNGAATFARGDGTVVTDEHFVTIEDGETTITVKTSAQTVEDLLSRAGIEINEADIVNPGLDAEIEGEDFTVGIWRARPVVISDGVWRRYLTTTETDAREVVTKYGREIHEEDEVVEKTSYDFLATGPAYVYEVSRNYVEPEPEPVLDLSSKLDVSPLTARRGVNRYYVMVNGQNVYRKETYYDLPMGGVMAIAARECHVPAYYEVREDGVKVDAEGYVLVAADLNRYPRCSAVETSLGLGRVYDTGAFALSNPEQFDLATDWTNRNGK